MEAYERTAVADAFEEQSYRAGEVILREGEPGDTFYLLVAGTAAATKAGAGGNRLLLEYKEGDYFGELALLNNRRVMCMCMARAWHVHVHVHVHVHGMCMCMHVHGVCMCTCAWRVHSSRCARRGVHAHSPLTPHPSPLAPHPSPLTPRPSPLTPRPSRFHLPCYMYSQAACRLGRVPHRLRMRAPRTAHLRASAGPRHPHP